MSETALPPGLEGKTRPSGPDIAQASFRISIALSDNGTRWGRRAFILRAEISHVRLSRRISPQLALRTSPGRAAVSTRNSNASLVRQVGGGFPHLCNRPSHLVIRQGRMVIFFPLERR